MLNIVSGLWFGTPVRRELHDTMELWKLHREIYDWLQEWELAVLQPIGPEDSEWFATTNLDPDWGLPC
jgi:hypothetical protein